MKIGITYDLKSEYLMQGFSEEEAAEFDKEDTIDAIDFTLQKLGYQTERIGNIKQLAFSLVNGNRWDLVFNICEGMYGIGREAQVPALLDAWNIPYVFSNPLVLSLTLNKALTKSVLRDAHIPTADFFVVKAIEDIENVKINYPLFAKPIAEGTGKGIDSKSIIYDGKQLFETCKFLLDKFQQPVLIEKFLSGREFTVGIVGTGKEAKCTGVMEIVLNSKAEKDIYSYINKDEYIDRVSYILVKGKIAEECENLALRVWNILDCEDAGRIDIRYNEEEIANFIEINPLAGLHPVHSDLPMLSRFNGISYEELFEMIMKSAIKKVKK